MVSTGVPCRPTPDHCSRQSWARSTIKLQNVALKRPRPCDEKKEKRMEEGRVEPGQGTQGRLPGLLLEGKSS